MKPFKHTPKLFFDKYVNKISLVTVLASEFRYHNLDRTISKISSLSKQIEKSKSGKIQIGGYHKKTVSVDDIFHSTKLCNILKTQTDYVLRVEGNCLGVYTNEDSVIENINNLGKTREISMPSSVAVREFLLANPHSIIAKKYTHKYRITVNPLRDITENFHQWAEKIPSIKLLRRTYHTEGYFYAANEKTLGMCRLFLGDRIRRVDEMFLESEIS